MATLTDELRQAAARLRDTKGCGNHTLDCDSHELLALVGGTGTTALIASTLGRAGITVDHSADYCRIAQWRTTDPGERARALGLPKPKVQPESQRSLFEATP